MATEFFNHTFTKAAFESNLDKKTKSTGALLGIVFDKAEGNNLCFAASVGYGYHQRWISSIGTENIKNGAVSISNDQVLDTESDTESTSSASSTSKEESEDDEEGV